MSFFKRKERVPPIPKTWKITRRCLRLILEASKSNYPTEFGGLLRVDATSKDTIAEIVLLPGTVSGDSHAIFQLHMLPIDFSVVGTVHSHPSGNISPSHVDLNHFFGRILMIVGYPFEGENCVAVYDSNGEKMPLQITPDENEGKH